MRRYWSSWFIGGQFRETLICLQSLKESSYQDFDIFLCDNSNGKLTLNIAEYPFQIFTVTKDNIGYTAAVNLGFQHARRNGYTYTWLLNNDTIVPAETLGKLLQYLEENPEIGAVSPSLPYYQNQAEIWSNGGRINWQNGSTSMIIEQQTGIKYPDFLTGCALLVRISAIQDEWMLSEKFYAYFEDVDLSMRIKKTGHKIALVSDVVVFHDIDIQKRDISNLVIYLMTRNRYYFFSAYLKGLKRLAVLLNIFLRDIRTILAFSLKSKHKQSRSKAGYIRLGILDAIRQNYYLGTYK